MTIRICLLCKKPLFKGQKKRMVMVRRDKTRGVMVHTHCLKEYREKQEEERRRARISRLSVVKAGDVLITPDSEPDGGRDGEGLPQGIPPGPPGREGRH